MRVEKVFEYNINDELRLKLQQLLVECFPEDYPQDRIYFKHLPHFRFIVFDHYNKPVGQVGLD